MASMWPAQAYIPNQAGQPCGASRSRFPSWRTQIRSPSGAVALAGRGERHEPAVRHAPDADVPVTPLLGRRPFDRLGRVVSLALVEVSPYLPSEPPVPVISTRRSPYPARQTGAWSRRRGCQLCRLCDRDRNSGERGADGHRPACTISGQHGAVDERDGKVSFHPHRCHLSSF